MTRRVLCSPYAIVIPSTSLFLDMASLHIGIFSYLPLFLLHTHIPPTSIRCRKTQLTVHVVSQNQHTITLDLAVHRIATVNRIARAIAELAITESIFMDENERSMTIPEREVALEMCKNSTADLYSLKASMSINSISQ